MPARAKPRVPRPENSFGKKFTTCEKGSMGYATQSRRLPSASPRREKRECSSHARLEERLRRKRSARIAGLEGAGPPQNARRQEAKHSSGKAEEGLRIALYRLRRARPSGVERDRAALRLL